MIFITVGTHEQPFNRLIQKVDELIRDGEIQEEVFMQIGYSTYEPKYTKWEKVIGYDEMADYLKKSDVVITHGGPSTYMQVLEEGKIPVVVPRQEKFGEHVNDHQLWVSKQVRDKNYPLIICEDIESLLTDIEKSREMNDTFINSHNDEFIKKFNIEINQLVMKSEKI
ncbi:glycosyltransferase [Lactococcus chungangensis]|jgi:UDP-N-acetylglucosamine transferase subunit ALG13|uniref:glycosyltransferase n=1 Tax=Lactobacillales TaxID=186826 RepID=UPI0028D537B8|nr:glycosyltransferase [Lactococcus chungangensis]